ncbi:sensor histidine kinase [Paracrocinitomix mangrovi]|uniref:sensor histidine kinase n=1 Tax=Paracrocinitomix mangrovi TaxID=2862509 RepID=UPI001C8E8C84|nr:sensor histidine kinase [Paracrocinitomix mangrovi]UKN02443.1 sensor histidine kinase [Paracrocinitomix mangrovi]
MGLLTPSKIQITDHLDRAKFLFLWRLTLLFVLLLSLLAVLFFFLENSYTYITYMVGDLIAISGLVYLYYTQDFRRIFIAFGTLGSVIVQLDLFLIQDSHHYPGFLWMTMLIILAFYGIGKIWGVIILIANIVGTVVFFLTTLYDHYDAIVITDHNSALLIAIELPVIMIIISYLVFLDEKAHEQIQNDLIEANKSLEANNREISRRDQEKTILVKEIHHRVKNNLQIIISLLRLQMTDIKNHESRQHFSEAINRVMVMSSIHQKLYKEQDLTEFSLVSYIEDLSSELKLFFLEEFPVDITVESDYRIIDLKTVVPVGLIMNELLSNSFKYAFESSESGKISIFIKDQGEYFDLIYFDNGTWKETTDENAGFGLELINTLAEQLNGTVEFKTGKEGTFYKFHLQKLTD